MIVSVNQSGRILVRQTSFLVVHSPSQVEDFSLGAGKQDRGERTRQGLYRPVPRRHGCDRLA